MYMLSILRCGEEKTKTLDRLVWSLGVVTRSRQDVRSCGISSRLSLRSMTRLRSRGAWCVLGPLSPALSVLRPLSAPPLTSRLTNLTVHGRYWSLCITDRDSDAAHRHQRAQQPADRQSQRFTHLSHTSQYQSRSSGPQARRRRAKPQQSSLLARQRIAP